MKEQSWYTDIKTDWPRGPWDDEPDKIQWIDDITGLPCLIHRNRMGALCGYVGVPEDHPVYKKHYDEHHFTVHGGLTYGDLCAEGDDPSIGICHIPEPGEPDNVYWLGFDCGHLGDLSPNFENIVYPGEFPKDVYRDVGYVKQECTQLAVQLKEMV